jgi:hypothetical protein
MIKESVQAETVPAYYLRGRGIYELHSEDILEGYLGAGRYLVSSGTTPGLVYEVRVSPMRPARDRCECQGYARHGHCSHHVAAQRVARRSAVCDACGVRQWWRELEQVHEEDELLAWFPGDVLCRACIKAGACVVLRTIIAGALFCAPACVLVLVWPAW